MNDLFKKLNVLVRASINDVLGEDLAVGQPRRRPLTPEKLGKNIDREIVSLRERINEALAFEDELQKRAQSIQDKVARWDQQADEAVAAGNEAVARHAVEQMQLAQQRLAMAESDLHEHQLVTQELIQRVNMLEAAVADARRAQEAEKQQAAEAPPAPAEVSASPDNAVILPRVPSLSDVLRDAQDKISRMGDLVSAQQEMNAPSPAEEAAEAAQKEHIEDDLETRRQRLSKPKPQ
ncbi:MAG TPA: PspA/IM30 family protein [Phototrophicaceae bacterium]|nr:PspA/IM30 family protein [Phototrophicaceae bacterium]